MSSAFDLDPMVEVSLPLNDESVLPNVVQSHQEEEELVPPPQSRMGVASVPLTTPAPAAASTSSVVSEGGFGGNRRHVVTMKDYQADLEKLRRDNLQLKLRIYLLEEQHGLTVGKNETKENVYRINLDLRVHNETLKKDLQEQTKLLKAAYDAIENMEFERLREREEYESQIESLKHSVLESRFGNQDGSKAMTAEDNNMFSVHNSGDLNHIEIGDRSRALLADAFGNFDEESRVEKQEEEELDTHLETMTRMGEEKNMKISELQEQIQQLQKQVKESEAMYEAVKADLEDKEEELTKETAAFDKLTKEFHAKIGELQKQLNSKGSRVSAMEQELMEFRKREEQEKANLIAQLRKKYDDKQHSLEKTVAELEQKNQKLHEDLEKNFRCIQGMAESNHASTSEDEKMSKDLLIREKALEKLTQEYEKLKFKVRKYKAEGFNLTDQNSTNNSTEAEMVDRGTIGKLISELDEAKSREAILKSKVDRLQDIVKDNEQNYPSTSSRRRDSNTDKVVVSFDKEVATFNHELQKVKEKCLREGAKQALKKATSAYTNVAHCYTDAMKTTIDVFRKRLLDLVEFFERLLSLEHDGRLDFSMISDSIRASLHRSVEESRRLSQSISASFMTDDPNDTQYSNTTLGNEIEIPKFTHPNLEGLVEEVVSSKVLELGGQFVNQSLLEIEVIKSVDVDMKDSNCFDTLVEVMRDNIQMRVDAQQEMDSLREELESLKSSQGFVNQHDYIELEYRIVELEEQLAEEKRYSNEVQERLKLKKEREAVIKEEAIKSKEMENALAMLKNELEMLRASVSKAKEAQNCDCQSRTKELERLLSEQQKLYKVVHEKLQREYVLKIEKDREIMDAASKARKMETIAEKLKGELEEMKSTVKKNKQSCDCLERIKELERLLEEQRKLYDETVDQLDREQELKREREKAMKKEMLKTKKVLLENRAVKYGKENN